MPNLRLALRLGDCGRVTNTRENVLESEPSELSSAEQAMLPRTAKHLSSGCRTLRDRNRGTGKSGDPSTWEKLG